MFKFSLITFVFIINKIFSTLSLNQPKFCPNATWNPNAITFADESTVGTVPFGIFIDTNNTVYVAADSLNRVQVWFEGSLSPITPNFSGLSGPGSLFVTISGDIYVSNNANNRIDKSRLNATQSITVMNRSCTGLFIDINNNLYCSIYDNSIVIKKSLNSDTSVTTIVAGNGSEGLLSNMLCNPWGIFVDINFNLYVADAGNHRIQFFKSGELDATTLVGNGALETFSITYPNGIVLDGDNYLFIVDRGHSRIVGQGPYGFRCLVGCTELMGPASHQLDRPTGISFDSYGNIFVTDRMNNRVQKFIFLTNSCDETNLIKETTTTSESTSSNSIEQESTMKMVTSESISQLPIVHQNCFSVQIELISKQKTFPIEYKLNEDIFVSSNIEFSCRESFSISFEWIISNCTLNCSIRNLFNENIARTSNEIYFPSKVLTFGIYQFELRVNVTTLSNSLFSSESIRIQIVQSQKLIVNLIDYGTTEITHGQNQELLIEPEKYSRYDDGTKLIENEWIFQYYCRIYDSEEFFSPISNSSCFSNQSGNQRNSSLKIVGGSFQLNRTYQLMVNIINRFNSTLTNHGYLIVQIQKTFSHRISIGCVISTMCIHQLINPNTQVSLYSNCLDNCSLNKIIHWNIYQGKLNVSTNLIDWSRLNRSILTFGENRNNLTVSNELFVSNPSVDYFKFEVIYIFSMGNSSSSIHFKKNSPPENGSCEILYFNDNNYIFCSNWSDENGIKDYLFYIRTDNSSESIMIGFSLTPRFKLHFPFVNSLLNIIVHIRLANSKF